MPFNSLTSKVISKNFEIEDIPFLDNKNNYWNYYTYFELDQLKMENSDYLDYQFDINSDVFSNNQISYKNSEYDNFRLELYKSKTSIFLKDNIENKISNKSHNIFKLRTNWVIDKDNKITEEQYVTSTFNIINKSSKYKIDKLMNALVDEKMQSSFSEIEINLNNQKIKFEQDNSTNGEVRIIPSFKLDDIGNLNIDENGQNRFIYCLYDCSLSIKMKLKIQVNNILFNFNYENEFSILGVDRLFQNLNIDFLSGWESETKFKKTKLY